MIAITHSGDVNFSVRLLRLTDNPAIDRHLPDTQCLYASVADHKTCNGESQSQATGRERPTAVALIAVAARHSLFVLLEPGNLRVSRICRFP